MKKKTCLGVMIASLLTAATFGANAQSLVGSNTNAAIGEAGHNTTIVFTNTAGNTIGAFDFRVTYNAANLTSNPVTTNFGGAVCDNSTAGTVLCYANPLVGLTLPASITITLPFDIGATAAVEPLTISNIAAYDTSGAVPLPGTSGSITITAGPPPDVIVTFTPASGSTVAFGGGLPGANVTQSIAIGNLNSNGTGTVSGCVISGPDAASFTITGGNPSTVPPATSLGLQATLGTAGLNATLTCNVADASATTSATWTLTTPAAPTLGANPASGTAITLPNSYGTPVSSNIVIAPETGAGGDAGGPNATLTCSTGSAGFTVTPAGALTFTPPGGAAQNVAVGCTPGAAAISGTVTCSGTDQAGGIAWSWPVNCPAAQTAPPPPTFVPASSLWSKLALFGVFAALGMLILGLRRNH